MVPLLLIADFNQDVVFNSLLNIKYRVLVLISRITHLKLTKFASFTTICDEKFSTITYLQYEEFILIIKNITKLK